MLASVAGSVVIYYTLGGSAMCCLLVSAVLLLFAEICRGGDWRIRSLDSIL